MIWKWIHAGKTLHRIYMDAMAKAFGPVIDIFITAMFVGGSFLGYCKVGRLFRKKSRRFSPHRSPTVGQISHALSVVALRGVWTWLDPLSWRSQDPFALKGSLRYRQSLYDFRDEKHCQEKCWIFTKKKTSYPRNWWKWCNSNIFSSSFRWTNQPPCFVVEEFYCHWKHLETMGILKCHNWPVGNPVWIPDQIFSKHWKHLQTGETCLNKKHFVYTPEN